MALSPPRATAVKQVSDGTQQVPEKVAWCSRGVDVEHDLVQVNHQPKEVEVQGPKRQMQDRARP